MPEIILVFREDGSVGWKPAGNATRKTTNEDDWVDGPECPIHGPWVVKQRKDGSGYFYSCNVPQGEPWCKKRVSTRPGSWGEANPPVPQGDPYDGLDDLPFG